MKVSRPIPGLLGNETEVEEEAIRADIRKRWAWICADHAEFLAMERGALPPARSRLDPDISTR